MLFLEVVIDFVLFASFASWVKIYSMMAIVNIILIFFNIMQFLEILNK